MYFSNLIFNFLDNYVFSISICTPLAQPSKTCRLFLNFFCQHKLLGFVDQCAFQMLMVFFFTKFKVSIFSNHFHLNLCKVMDMCTWPCLCTQVIWQGLHEYARNAWDVASKDVDQTTIYDDTLGNYHEIWGGNKLLYHGDNTRTMHWRIRAPNMGLVDHV